MGSRLQLRVHVAGPRVGRLVAATVLVLVTLGFPAPAHAHTELVRASPDLGAVVSATTDRMVLGFSGDLVPGASEVVVHAPDGSDVTTGRTATFRDEVQARLQLSRPGRYSVGYRVAGSDGHVVTGRSWFTVAVADTRDVVAGGVDGPAPLRDGRGNDVARPGSSSSLLWWVVAAGIAVLVPYLHGLSRRGTATKRQASTHGPPKAR